MKRLLCALIFVALAGVSQVAVDRTRGEGVEAFLYAPQRNAFRYLAFGHYGLMADLLYIRTNVYLKRHFVTRDLRYLFEMYATITTLDPYFAKAYHYGAIFLSAIAYRPREGLYLLEQGMKYDEDHGRPPNPDFYLEAFSIHLVDLGDLREAKRVLQRYIDHSGADPVVSSFFRGFLERAQDSDPVAFGIKHWRDRIGRPRFREQASGIEFEPREGDADTIDLQSQQTGDIVRVPRMALGQRFEPVPQPWQELSSGADTRVIPLDEDSVRVIGPDGATLDLTLFDLHDRYHPLFHPQGDDILLQTARQRIREIRTYGLVQTVRARIGDYREEHKASPPDLRTVYSLAGDIPLPFVGGEWFYDPVSGDFHSKKLTEGILETEVSLRVHEHRRTRGRFPTSVDELSNVVIPPYVRVSIDPLRGDVRVVFVE